MSCTVVAVPYALFWVIGTLITTAAVSSENEIQHKQKHITKNDVCDDVYKITEEHFIEKDFETPFMDKNLLLKTLEEHGVTEIAEFDNKISGKIDGYLLNFEKRQEDKPYYLKIQADKEIDAKEEIRNLNSEYAMNVQEDTYNHIIEKLKDNNMSIEEEVVEDDNTIVLTVNIDG